MYVLYTNVNGKLFLSRLTFNTTNNTLSFICAVHILDECIDIIECDSIYISYVSKNIIRTIQRMCRCLRKDNKNKNI